MKVSDILKLDCITPAVTGEDADVTRVFCCDLLSIAMARAPEGCAWVTVMTNANVVAVAALAEVACVVLAEGYAYDEAALSAAQGKVTLLKSSEPIYETAVKVGAML